MTVAQILVSSDMHQGHHLKITKQDDGDITIMVNGKDAFTDRDSTIVLELRNPGRGTGHPDVWHALNKLLEDAT